MLTVTAVPNPVVEELSFIPSAKPRYTNPPELILSFDVRVAPPTYVTCQVGSTPVDVADLSREVTAGEYLPPSTASPVTNVTVTLRTRQAGNYTCTVSVFRASGSNLPDATTSISISGRTTVALSVNDEEKINTFVFLTVTDTPTGFKSVRTGEYTVKLSWTTPASNTPPVAGYEMFYAESGSNIHYT